MADYILTPVGRLVQGHPMTENTTDMHGKPMTTRDGKPRSEYFAAIAIPKTDPDFARLWQAMQAAAMQAWPGGQYNNPANFSWKLIDGDTATDINGQPYSNREGFAGHYVLQMKSGFPPKCYTTGGAQQITDPNMIKRGHYVRAYVSFNGNGNAQKPGIFVNMSMIEHVAYGPEIVSGPDGAAVFGGTPVAQLPAGATLTPPAPAGAPLAPPVAPVGYPAAPAAPAPVGYPAAPAPAGYPAAPAAPAHDFLQPPVAPTYQA